VFSDSAWYEVKGMKSQLRGSDVKRKHGFTVPMLALFIVILFAFAALAVDVGVLYTARTAAQHAADSAALAGAFTFRTQPTAVDKVAAAREAAIAVAAKSSVLGQPVTITAANVLVDTTKYRVTVTVPRTGANGITTYFAKVIGFDSVDVQAKATAEAALNLTTGTYCLKPFYMPAQWGVGCTGGSIFDGNGQLQSQYVGAAIPNGGMWQQDPRTQDDWGMIDVGNLRGGNQLRTAIETCFDANVIRCGDSFTVEPGRQVGPIMQGVDNLITDFNTVRADTWQSVGHYIDGETGAIKDTSRSLVVVPVWDCTGVAHGRPGTVSVAGFGIVFIDNGTHNGSSQGVAGHMVSATRCAAGGGAGGGGGVTGTGPLATPVRLIQTPTGG
jgi:Flp pilus assembly protein TadG